MEFVMELFDRGGPIMWPLFVCSLLSVTITIERIFFWIRERDRGDDKLIINALDLAEAGDFAGAVKSSDTNSNYISRVLWAGLAQREHGISDVVQMAANREVEKMKTGLAVLDTIITMAPFLGILGTVMGIIDSFDMLGVSGIEDPRAVTGGIAQALVTTAAGLAVALVTLIPYNCFVARVQGAAKKLETMGAEMDIVYRKTQKRNNA